MKKILIIMVCLVSFACAEKQVIAQPAPAAPSDTIKLSVPNWPVIGYANADNSAYVILVVRDPKTFPIPKEIAFQPKEGPPVVMTIMPANKVGDK